MKLVDKDGNVTGSGDHLNGSQQPPQVRRIREFVIQLIDLDDDSSTFGVINPGNVEHHEIIGVMEIIKTHLIHQLAPPKKP